MRNLFTIHNIVLDFLNKYQRKYKGTLPANKVFLQKPLHPQPSKEVSQPVQYYNQQFQDGGLYQIQHQQQSQQVKETPFQEEIKQQQPQQQHEEIKQPPPQKEIVQYQKQQHQQQQVKQPLHEQKILQCPQQAKQPILPPEIVHSENGRQQQPLEVSTFPAKN